MALLENRAFQQLSELHIVSSDVNQENLETFAKLSLPGLKRLIIDLDDYKPEPARWNFFRPFFQNDSLPSLTQLDITYTGYDLEILMELLSSPLLPRLKKLSIAGHFENSGPVQLFLDRADSFKHLDKLIISRGEFSAEVEDKLYTVYGKDVLGLES